MNEYCPICFYPLDASGDDDGRLCSVCQWFGDKTETVKTSPSSSELEKHFANLISLYRDMCRAEFSGEILTEKSTDPKHQRLLQLVKERAQQCRHSLLFFFRGSIK